MKKNFKHYRVQLLLAAAVIAVFIFSLFLLNPLELEEEGPVKIYYADNVSTAHLSVINAFNEFYKGEIEVVPVDLPFTKFSTNERKEILTRALRSKSDRIDVMAVDLIWVKRFAKWAHPLQDYFSPSDLDDILDHALVSCYDGDVMVAAPMYIDVGLLYYRPDLLGVLEDSARVNDKLDEGISWDEFLSVGQRLKANYDDVYLFAGDSFEGLLCSFYESIPGPDKDHIFLKDTVQLNHASARFSMQMLHDLIYKHKLTPAVVTAFDEVKCREYLLQHDVPFIRFWPGLNVSKDLPKHQREQLSKYRAAPLPRHSNQDKSAVFGGWNLIVSDFSPHKNEAATFVKFVQTEKAQRLLYENGGYVPVRASLFDDAEYTAKNPRLTAMKMLLETGKHRPYRDDYTRISDILSFYINQYLEDRVTLDEALARSVEDIQKKQLFLR